MPKYIDADALKIQFPRDPSEPLAWYSDMAIKNIINLQPSADVRENTHGRWIEDDYAFNHCSECGYEQESAEYVTPYCPQCGASMEPDPEEATAHNRDCKLTRHKAICDGIHDLYERKNHDYGGSFGQSFRDHGILAGVIRIEDKFNRLKTLAGGAEQMVKDESIKDTLRDMANYAIMTLLEMEVQNEENQSH